MPRGKEVVVHWPQKQGNVEKFIEVLQRDLIWICLGGHRRAKGVVEEVQRNAAVVLQHTEQAQAHA